MNKPYGYAKFLREVAGELASQGHVWRVEKVIRVAEWFEHYMAEPQPAPENATCAPPCPTCIGRERAEALKHRRNKLNRLIGRVLWHYEGRKLSTHEIVGNFGDADSAIQNLVEFLIPEDSA